MSHELEREIGRIGPGDHLCLMYEEPAEALLPAAYFLRRGLERGGHAIYVVDDHSVAAVTAALESAGIDVAQERERGALRFLTAEEYCPAGEFEPQRMLARFRALGDEVAAAGVPLVHAAVEMTWALTAGAPLDLLAEYESWGNDIFEHVTGASLCMYNRRRFPAAALERLLRAHPVVVLGSEVAPNPFYEPPELFFGGHQDPELRFRWMVDQLQRARADRRERDLLAERTRALETEREARAAAEELSREKSRFMAVVSHELRTPLTAIMGYTELLEQEIGGPLTERQREQLERIATSSRHLMTVINDILDLSRAEAGGLELRPGSVDVTELGREVLTLVAPQAAERGLELRSEIPEGPATMETDPGRVRQILLNLLSNAVKFTEEGAVALRMAVADDGVRFEVSDTGVGIDEPELERIFEAFHQGGVPGGGGRSGAGLGLAVSRGLARAMGGDVVVESTPGRGSVFTLSLPRRVASALQPA